MHNIHIHVLRCSPRCSVVRKLNLRPAPIPKFSIIKVAHNILFHWYKKKCVFKTRARSEYKKPFTTTLRFGFIEIDFKTTLRHRSLSLPSAVTSHGWLDFRYSQTVSPLIVVSSFRFSIKVCNQFGDGILHIIMRHFRRSLYYTQAALPPPRTIYWIFFLSDGI